MDIANCTRGRSYARHGFLTADTIIVTDKAQAAAHYVSRLHLSEGRKDLAVDTRVRNGRREEFKDFIKVEASAYQLLGTVENEREMKVIPYNIMAIGRARSSGARWITLEDHLDQDGRKATARTAS